MVDINEILCNMDKYAKEFSEGEPQLEKTLKKLWENDFVTIGCCKGHKDHGRQYIGLKRKDNKKIMKLLSALNKEDITISFLFKNISIKKNKESDIYSNVLNSLEKVDDIKIDEDILKVIDFIDNSNYDYTNIHFYYYKGVLNKYVNTCDVNLINILKTKYDYKITVSSVFGNNLPGYHFIIK